MPVAPATRAVPAAAAALLADLGAILPPDRLITDPDELFVYESDGFTIAHARPAAVCFPITTDEVARVVTTLVRHDAQVVPRGSGTGLAGGCVAYDLGVVVSVARMNRVLAIDLDNRVAHVEAGVRNLALSDAVALEGSGVRVQGSAEKVPPKTSPARDPEAAGAGLARPALATSSSQPATPYHFAPDPSSQRASTIGGNASTNAGGIHTLKDFVTSNHVLGFEMVLADGSVIEVGATDGCYESGPFDLPGLICGHEGTLGIITRLWVRLVPKATSFRTAVAVFASSADACNAVSEVIAAGVLPAAMEMMDGTMIRIVEDAFHFGFPPTAQALVLIEIDGIDALLDEQLDDVIAICTKHHATSVEKSSDPARRAALWKARKGAFGAIGRVSHSYCTQDACVPRSTLAQVLERIDRIGKEHGIAITNVFHAGDGNVHPIFMYDERDPAAVANVMRAAERVLQYCIDVGGTTTGEHGVGVEKLHLMPYQFDRPTMAMFDRVKRAFDPDERINAGKLLPSDKVKISLVSPGRQSPQ
ncbi:MAG TPA: FAD-linked oxidase C-terminal domain-containing protein [Tepidisphaeraceae bacterium]|nr:FAD-linked oxidase C-terminal domain-containing protein [Tepidisphaeraceae bacterium]